MELDANDLMQTLAAQRNAAMDEVAKLTAIVQKLTRDNEALELEVSKAKLPAPKPPRAKKVKAEPPCSAPS